MKKLIVTLLLLSVSAISVADTEVNVSGEIRHLLTRYNPDKAELIKHISLAQGLVNTSIKTIDQYARWFSVSDQTDRFLASDSAGIGADLFYENDQWWLAPWLGGSLYEQGITERVQLSSVEGQPVTELDKLQLARLLRGSKNTVVCLEVLNDEKTTEFCLLRKQLKKPTVEKLSKNSVRIRDFRSHETRVNLQLLIAGLYENKHKVSSPLTVDLRESLGGDLHEAFDTSALFLPPNMTIATLRQADGRNVTIKVPSSLPEYQMPLTILVGADTASAAEVFAGVLQVTGRAQLKGSKTRGKCVSQTDFTLSDGSVLRLTNLQVFFSDGSSCQGKGLNLNQSP